MRGKTLLTVIGTSLLTIGVSLGTSMGQPAKPLDDSRTHVGIQSCAGSTCHSNAAPVGRVVRQNELVTWQDPTSVTGAHSRTYSVLLTKQGRAIARNLGIGSPEKSPECLECHAHNVAPAKRGPGFQLSEGVTCEACHGGAGDWRDSHYTVGATHADNIARGLYPTDNVESRASLCLDCHYGSARPGQFVTHRIMGAGHPRMSFELDLFTALQKHHDVDADYLERKTDVGGFKTWAVGQAMAMQRSAELFANDRIARDGLFPELYFFDCHACHKTISNDPKALARWRSNPGRPLGPGRPVYNDANNIMLHAALIELAPARAQELSRLTKQLHAATRSSAAATQSASAELANFAAALEADLMAADFDRTTATNILDRIVGDSISREYTNYAAGEQAVMAVDTFVNAMIDEGYAEPALKDRIGPALDEAYAAVLSPNSYSPSKLRKALQKIAAVTGSL